MAGERWIFTKEQLLNTPSRKSGIENDKELIYRQQAANLIQDMGQRLQVTQLCINTAIVYMHRFYMFHSFQKFHRNAMAAACLFLAAKVEEQPRKLEHVVKVSNICQNKETPDTKSEEYLNEAHQLVINESILLQTLGFDLTVDHPHTNVVKTCQLVKATKDLAQTSYFLATNSLHLTAMCLQYKPTIVACVCVHLACKWSKWEIPSSYEGKEWFWYSDPSVTTELLEELTQEFLNILDQCPSKLKKKILMWRSGKEREKLMDDADLNLPPEKKVKMETSTSGSTSSSKSHPSSHHHTLSNHDRKSDHHKSSTEHHATKSVSGENTNKNAIDSKPKSLSATVVPTLKAEPQTEVKSEPEEPTATPQSSAASTTITTFKEYKERKEKERLLALNKSNDQMTNVKHEKLETKESKQETDVKQTGRHFTDHIQKQNDKPQESQKYSDRHVLEVKHTVDVQKGDKHVSDTHKLEEKHKHREKHTPDVQKHSDKHTPDGEKHRKSHKHESRKHGERHSHSKHAENKHASDSESSKHIVNHENATSSQVSSNEIGKIRIKTDTGAVPQVNEIGKIRIKTEPGGSPLVVKQEAEIVPGSETKIRIKTEPGISPRLKVESSISPHVRTETGISPRIKTETGISPTVSQDAASPLKMKIKNISKEHHKSSHQSEQKVPSLKISSKMLTESRHSEHKSHSEHKTHKSKHSDKEHGKSHTGTNGKPELKLHISMSAINKHKNESKKHHKSSHSDRGSSDEKSSGKSGHSHKSVKESSHSSGNRKRQMSPNSDASSQSKTKISKVDSKGLNRSSSNYSNVSMEMSDSASVDGSVNGDKKGVATKEVLDQIQAMNQVIDLIKSTNPILANSLPGTPTTPTFPQPPLPPLSTQPPPPPPPPPDVPPPPPPPFQQSQLYQTYGSAQQYGNQYLQPQFGYQQSLFDIDFLSDEAMPPLPSEQPTRPPTPPLGPPHF